MNSAIVILAALVPMVLCCLAALVVILCGAAPVFRALGAAGALLMASAGILQLMVNLSAHDGAGWLWLVQAVSLISVAGLVMLGVAATGCRARRPSPAGNQGPPQPPPFRSPGA